MEQLKFCKVREVKSPTKAHSNDAGIDFYIPNDFDEWVMPHSDVLIPSGIKVCIPDGYCLIAHDKSGVAAKLKLHVFGGVIDQQYSGEIVIGLFNNNDESVHLVPGQKIVQFCLLPVPQVEITEVDENEYKRLMENSDRGEGGFGSTGAF